MCGGHSLAEVFVIVDWQQVSMDVCVSDHHLHVGDAVDVHDELEELLKLTRLDAVDRESAELCSILQ